MRAIGKNKIQIYLEKTDEITDEKYFKLAVKEEIIKNNQKKNGFTKEECVIILSKVMELYQYVMWKDDVSEIKYQKEVVQIQTDNVSKFNEEGTQVELKDINSTVQVGDVIVIENPQSNEKLARKVKEISNGSSLILEEVELQEVIESVVVSDIESISSEDVYSYYEELSRNGESQKQNVEIQDYKLVPVEYRSWESEGFTVQLESEDGEITASIVNGGIAYKVPFAEGVIKAGTVSASINLNNICVGTQVVASAENGVEYFNLQTQADIDVEGEISLEATKSVEIPLFKKPLLFAGGIISTDVEFYFVISVDGSMKVEARIPTSCALDYSKGQGIRSPRIYVGMEEPQIIADCTLSMFFRNEIIPKILGIQLLDVELDTGVKGTGNATSRNKNGIFQCADLAVFGPFATFSISADDDKNTLVGEYISAEWEIFNEENTLFNRDCHFEFYKDGKIEKVDECTFKFELSIDAPHLYTAYFKEPFVDKGDYYEVKGTLLDDVGIVYSDLLELAEGDVYEYDGINFTYIGNEVTEWYTRYNFKDEYGKRYYVSHNNQLDVQYGGEHIINEYFFAEDMIEVDGIQYEPIVSAVIDEEFIFKIPKYVYVWLEVSEGNVQYISIEEIFNKEMEDYEGICISRDSNIPIHVDFDVENNVWQMNVERYRDERRIAHIKTNN